MNRSLCGLSDIRTNQKIRVRSKTRPEGSEYLDLFLMIKERQRLEGYKAVIAKSNDRTDENLIFVAQGIERLQESVTRCEGHKTKSIKKAIPGTSFKSVAIDY